MALSIEERERRYRIIEKGRESEFWKVMHDSLIYVASEKLKEVADLMHENKVDEARLVEASYRAILYLADEPQRIMDANRSLFDEYYYELCKACRTVIKKLRPIKGKPKTDHTLAQYGL